MKIIHLVSNKVWGGGEQYVLDLTHHLLAEGREVEMVCRPFAAVTERMAATGAKVSTAALRGALDIASGVKVAKIIGREPCVVHVHNFKDAFTAAYARHLSGNKAMRLVMTRHLVRPGKTSWLYRWLYGEIDHLIFVSDLARQTFLSTHPAIDERKTTVVHNSIVVRNSTEAEDLRQQYGIADGDTVAMYHGRIAREKGLLTLADALRQVGDSHLHLIIVGTGDEAFVSEMMTHAGAMSNNIHLAGFKSDVLPYVRQADYGVLPSIVSEACPLACPEYMSQGKAIITTDNGGQREFVSNDSTGILIPPGDSDALASALRRLTADKSLRQKMGTAGRDAFVTSMSYNIFLNKIKNIYEQ